MAWDATIPFRELLKRARTAAGFTQAELAERAQLSARAISDLERGVKLRPYAYTVGRLARALELGEGERAQFQAAARGTGIHASTRRVAPLPCPSTSFVGRRRELAQVRTRLQCEDVRLLTLTGPGGIGKTRLALEAIRDMEDTFPDGMHMVFLAALDDPGTVAFAIASELGLAEVDGAPITDALVSYLRDKRLLLVLDNFEHLRAATDMVAHLILSCPTLTVLVTSRAPLHLAAEYEYPVPPLSMPDSSRLEDPAVLAEYDAVALFLRRAEMTKPDFELTAANARAVAAICQCLDGLPLAIELAVARVKLFPPHVLLRGLAKPLTMLTGGPTDLPARHRSLRSALDWSYALLHPDEQVVFQRLAVFSNRVSLEAVEAVCDSSADLLDHVSALVDSSLLAVGETDGEPWCRMLQTIREYGVERLGQSGDEPAVRAQHAAYYLHLAEQAHSVLVVNDVPEWLDHMQEWHDDLRAALTWFLQQGENEQALRLSICLWAFWNGRGYYHIARPWLETVVALPAAGVDHLRAAALIALGVVLNSMGEAELAAIRTRESLALAKELGDTHLILACLRQLARSAIMRRELTQAQRVYAESMAMAQKVGDDLLVAAALHGLALVCLCLGDHDKAVAYAEECLAHARITGNARTTVTGLNDLGCALLGAGNVGRAVDALQEGVALARDAGLHWSLANTLNSLGLALFMVGDLYGSDACQRESLAVADELQDRGLIAYGLEGSALVAEAHGRSEQAVCLWGAAESLRGTTSSPLPFEQELYRRAQVTARERLGDAIYGRRWRQGRAMTVDQALTAAGDVVAPDMMA